MGVCVSGSANGEAARRTTSEDSSVGYSERAATPDLVKGDAGTDAKPHRPQPYPSPSIGTDPKSTAHEVNDATVLQGRRGPVATAPVASPPTKLPAVPPPASAGGKSITPLGGSLGSLSSSFSNDLGPLVAVSDGDSSCSDEDEDDFLDEGAVHGRFYIWYVRAHNGMRTRARRDLTVEDLLKLRAQSARGAAPESSNKMSKKQKRREQRDPVDPAEFVQAQHSHCIERAKRHVAVGPDGKLQRLYHTAGWYRLKPWPDNFSLRTSSSSRTTPIPPANDRGTQALPAIAQKRSAGEGSRLYRSNSGADHRPRRDRSRGGSSENMSSASQNANVEVEGVEDFYTAAFAGPPPPPVATASQTMPSILLRDTNLSRRGSLSSQKYEAAPDGAAVAPQSPHSPRGGDSGPQPGLNQRRVSFKEDTKYFSASLRKTGGRRFGNTFGDEDEDEREADRRRSGGGGGKPSGMNPSLMAPAPQPTAPTTNSPLGAAPRRFTTIGEAQATKNGSPVKAYGEIYDDFDEVPIARMPRAVMTVPKRMPGS